jgi:hypothetical protein
LPSVLSWYGVVLLQFLSTLIAIPLSCKTRHALSSDKEFHAVGDNTGIPYEKDFHSYKDYLEKNKKKRPVCALFKAWDASVFDPSLCKTHANGPDDSLDAGMQELENMPDEDSSESESGNN